MFIGVILNTVVSLAPSIAAHGPYVEEGSIGSQIGPPRPRLLLTGWLPNAEIQIDLLSRWPTAASLASSLHHFPAQLATVLFRRDRNLAGIGLRARDGGGEAA